MRIVALIAQLVLAPLANAGLNLSVNGSAAPTEITIQVDENLDLGFSTDATIRSGQSYVIAANQTTVLISGGTYVGPTDTYVDEDGYPQDNISGLTYDDAVNAAGAILPAEENGIFAGLAIFGGNGVPSNTNLWTNIALKGLATGDTTVKLYTLNPITFQPSSISDSVLIHVVPKVVPPIIPHSGILVYKVSANMSGYTFDPNTNARSRRPLRSPISGYIVADVNMATLRTNYPDTADGNSPACIIVRGNSFTVFEAAEPNVTAAFDIVPLSGSYSMSGRAIVRPHFNFKYKRSAFYDKQLMGCVRTAEIGMAAKKNVPSAIAGTAGLDISPVKKLSGHVMMTLDTKYTRLANKNNLSVAEITEQIRSDMARRYTEVSLDTFFAQ